MKILVFNSGSSSFKSSLYEIGGGASRNPAPPLWNAEIEWHDSAARAVIANACGARQERPIEAAGRGEAIQVLLGTLWTGEVAVIGSPTEVEIAGHRVVHGGPHYTEPVVITPQVRKAIAAMEDFAPLQNRSELEGMDIVQGLFGPIPQVAVFDTGFHRNLPPHSAVYPGPYEWYETGIRRYGFHGINYSYCSDRAAKLLGDPASLRQVICHLGSGCSLAAVKDGTSIDTTMGFTPLEGLMMGTRSGSVDPGILIYLARRGFSADRLDDLLNHRSGLLGVSGISGDLRQVLAAIRAGNARASLAFDMFVYRLRCAIGAMAAALGGIDALVFTAGTGENSSEVRASACIGLGFLGVKLDEAANTAARPDCDIAAEDARVRVFVIRAQEGWQIAQECRKLLQPPH